MWEWDESKDEANRIAHGVSFVEALEVFGDPLAATLFDNDRSEYEQRFNTVGMTLGHKLLSVTHTWNVLNEFGRIISAREATNRERIA